MSETFRVLVQRTVVDETTIIVRADNKDEAHDRALEMAGGKPAPTSWVPATQYLRTVGGNVQMDFKYPATTFDIVNVRKI